MRKLTLFLVLLFFGNPLHAETLDERLAKIPPQNIEACNTLSRGIFYQAAGGATEQVLTKQIDDFVDAYSYRIKMTNEERANLTKELIYGVFFELGRIKVEERKYYDVFEEFVEGICSGYSLGYWD